MSHQARHGLTQDALADLLRRQREWEDDERDSTLEPVHQRRIVAHLQVTRQLAFDPPRVPVHRAGRGAT